MAVDREPTRAAIYARISSDRTGAQAGVNRQLDDCRALVEDRGWIVLSSFIDNDISAFSGRRRPQFEALLASINDGQVDVVVVYHVDRLYRRLRDLVPLLDACEKTGARIATVQAGDIDLSTAAGRTIASILAAVAEGESARQAERIRREREASARAGKPNGSMRSFGYNKDGSINAAEAAIVRELVDRVLAGESVRSLVFEMTGRGVPTVKGGAWRGPWVRELLMSARLSGQREWTPVSRGRRGPGEIVAKGTWPAIITTEETNRLRELFRDPSRRTHRPGRYLLTGILMCGECRKPMNSHADTKGGRRYQCTRNPGTGKCGKRSVSAEPADAFVRDVVLTAVYANGPPRRFQEVRSAPDSNDEEFARLRDRLKNLARSYANDEIEEVEWVEARAILEQRIRESQGGGPSRPTALLSSLPDRLEQMRQLWDQLHVDRQRAIVSATLESIVLLPGSLRTNKFDPHRLELNWRADVLGE